MTAPTRVLVTGGSGFLGGHVIDLLVTRGYQVVALARSAEAAAIVEAHGAQAIQGDLDDPASIDAAFAAAAADVLINLASLGFGQAPTIVGAATDAGLERGVYVSSTAIFTSLNVPSKARRTAGEQTVTDTPLDWTIIRPTMIYGTPGDRNLARLLQVIKKVPALPMPGGGERLQQPVHVDDLAAAIVNALERPESVRRAYNVAGPEAITFRSLLKQAGDAVGRRPRLVPVPLGATTMAVGLYERLAPRPRLKAEQLERLSEDKAFDIGDAQRDLGFDPRPFAEGIRAEAAMLADPRSAPAGLVAAGNDNASATSTGTVSETVATGATNAPTLDHFEEVADTWIRRYEQHPSFQHRLAAVGRVITEVLDEYDDPDVLDFGGGPGVFAMVATTAARSVVCLDPSQPMVLAGSQRNDRLQALATPFGPARPDAIRRLVGTIDTIAPVPKFNVITAIAVLEYLDDPAATVRALGTRLLGGGRLIMTVPNHRSTFRRAEDVVGSLGATVGRIVRSQRLQSRAYASVRPHGNQVPWGPGAEQAGLILERVSPLTLGSSGVLGQVHATTVFVLRKPDLGDESTHVTGARFHDLVPSKGSAKT